MDGGAVAGVQARIMRFARWLSQDTTKPRPWPSGASATSSVQYRPLGPDRTEYDDAALEAGAAALERDGVGDDKL